MYTAQTHIFLYMFVLYIGVASWGAGARAPLDFQLVIWGITRLRKMYKNNAIFAQFSSVSVPFSL